MTPDRTTVSTELPVPERALAVGAHPDDIEFGCGATLAKWATAGCEVSLLVCTDGSKGTWDPHADLAELVVTRRGEQRAAALELGVTGDVVFCDWVDGELESGLRQRAVVTGWIRRLRPDVVLGHDPWKRYRLHPDHRRAGLLAVEGVVAARDPHFFTEQALPHHRAASLLLFEADEVNHVEDVGHHLDAKLAALEAHRSQHLSTMGIVEGDPTTREAFRDRIRREAGDHGALAGLAAGEAFHLIGDL